MPAPDLALLTEAARAAGKIALGYWKQAPKMWEKGADGPVTEADLAVNAALHSILRAARPGYGWLSEETPDTAERLQCEHLFIIDPIDGTRAFIAGEDSFSHSLAVVRNGEVTAACVYLPAKDRLYAASAGGPALCNGMEIGCSPCAEPDGATLLTPKASHAPEFWAGPPPGFTRAFRPSIAYRLCLVAEGRFDGLLTFRPAWEWDIAAGALIAARAGATVTDRSGAPLRFNSPGAACDGVLAAPRALHAALRARMAPRRQP